MLDNFFKHVITIEAGDAKSLALKIRSIPGSFQIVQIWSDGKKHYALINAGKKIPDRVLERMEALSKES